MMGPAHASTGLAAGALTLPLAPVHDVPSQIAWVVVMGGCAYLPDLDGPNATAAKAWGPITGVFARVVGFLAGGHRHRSHDLILAPVLFGAATVLAASNRWASLAVVALAVGLALEAVGRFLPGDWKSPGLNFIASIAVAYGLLSSGYDWSWLPFAVIVGIVVHILGDGLTTAGIPVPLTTLGSRKKSFGLRLFDAGHPIEKPITWACLGIAVVATVFWVGVAPFTSLA